MAGGEAQYGALADKMARKYGIDPGLFRRLITAESNWNPNAGSSAGARGLTQVVPKWHPDANLSTPAGQLDYGAKHLASLLKKYGNPRDALAVYNSGRPWSVSKSFGETNAYVTKILSGYKPTGQTSAPGAGAVPPAATPGAGAPLSGSLDAKRLMMLLNNQRERSLRGIMPAKNFQSELQKVLEGALPRAQVNAAGQQVGAQIAGAGRQVSASAPNYTGFPGITARQDPGPDGNYGFPTGGVDSGKVFRGGEGGDWGGSMPRALALARAVGATPSSEKRSRKLTASGNPSDHWVGSTQSYATDLPTSGAAGDALLKKIQQALGVSVKSGTWNNINIGGYRYQIGWRVPGHYDHIHVGVRKL